MKIRNDFVTNSSSTVFVFGTTDINESVDTTYSLIRMIVNEILYLKEKVESIFNSDINFIKFKKSAKDYDLYSYYIALLKVKSNKLEPIIKNSLFILLQEDFDIDMIFSDILDLYTRPYILNEFENIMNYSKYKDYSLLDDPNILIEDISNFNNLKDNHCLQEIVSDYFKYNKKYEYNNMTTELEDLKSFTLKNIGNIYVGIAQYTLIDLLIFMLDYFSSFSMNM